MSTLLSTEILNLSVAERILLVEDIWDSVAEVPEAGSPWGLAKERIKNNYGA